MPRRKMVGVQFAALTDEKIRNASVAEVVEATLHTKGVPKAGGPADARFGTCSRFYRCGTCKNSVLECPGHTGFISFPMPLPHVAFIPFLVKILSLFCFNCSAFLLPDLEYPEDVNVPKKKVAWMNEEGKKARNRKRNPLCCPCCGLPQPFVVMDEPFIRLEWVDTTLEKYFGEEVIRAYKPTKQRKRKATKKGNSKQPAAAEGEGEEPAPQTEEEIADFKRRCAEYEYFVKRPYSNWDAYNVLLSIKKADLERLAINASKTHPSGFMMLSMVVPAMTIRPTISFEEGSKRRGYHQYTRKLAEIMKQRRLLLIEAGNCGVRIDDQNAPGEYPESLENAIKVFYVTVSHYLVKDKCKVAIKMSQYAARAHARSESLADPLKGKKGLFRLRLMGKRVDFCIRTVVGPFPDADIDRIGVPRTLARRITVPVKVTARNRDALRALMLQGEVVCIVDEHTQNMIAVGEHNRGSIPLMDGWVVERYLRDGDFVIVNRQPTLHRPSMIGCRVTVIDESILRLPSPLTIPLNADHDGDEVNLHIPQTVEARAEVQELMHVPAQIPHVRANRPVIALIQDNLDAGYLMTHRRTLLGRADAMALLMAVKYDRDASEHLKIGAAGTEARLALPPPAVVHPAPLWTGKQIISCVLPRVSSTRALRNRPPTVCNTDPDPLLRADGELDVHNGELLRGTLCKQTLGTSNGGLVHLASAYCGNQVTARFLSDAQRMLNKFLIREGFTVGIADCKPPAGVRDKVRKVLAAAVAHIDALRTLASAMPHDGEVRRITEDQVRNTLKSMLHMVGNVVRAHLPPENAFNIMANIVGSKGSVFNIAQVMGLVGQTFVNGERPKPLGADRVLPSEPLPGQCELSLEDKLRALGLVDVPYTDGMSVPAAFLHCMGGREGLVDTAAKTSRTGYFQRRATKSMESQFLAQDGTVRDAYKSLYQMHFGNDGLDPSRTLRVKLGGLLLDDAALEQRCAGDPDELAALLRERDEIRRSRLTCFCTNLEQNVAAYLPYDVAVLVDQQRARCGCRHVALTPAQLAEARHNVNAVCEQLDREVPSLHTTFHLRCELSTARLRDHHRVCPRCVVAVCQRALEMHRHARMEAGEGVGALVATSMGEPLSQLTLNSVAYGTLALITVEGVSKVVQMGEFVDAEVEAALRSNRPGVEQKNDGTIWVPLIVEARIPSADEDGVVKWDRIEAVTRHPVVNRDGSTDLLRVTTAGGRVADVTMGESIVRMDPSTGKLVQARADELTTDDALPVTVRCPAPPVVNHTLDLRPYFDPSVYVHTSVTAAIWDEHQQNGGSFSAIARAGGATPYGRPDALLKSLQTKSTFRTPGRIYPKNTRHVNSLPELLPLDAETGFVLGYYAAEGSHSGTQAVWTNMDPTYNARLTAWLDRTGVAWHTAHAEVEAGTQVSTFAHSILLAKLMPELCGHLSRNKKVPDCMFTASAECVEGFIDGYFSGDGTFRHVTEITANSRSRRMLEGIAHLLTRFGIYSRIRTRSICWKESWEDIHDLVMQQGNACIFARVFRMTVPDKERDLDRFRTKEVHHRHRRDDPIEREDVVLEPVKSIERVQNDHPWVYDLTVERSRNMQMLNGVTYADSFHTSGTANVGMTQGVPRMKELIGATKKIATPVCTLPLKPGLPNPKVAAEALARSLPHTMLRNLLLSGGPVEVYEPDPLATTVEADAELVRRHAPFLEHFADRLSPWVIRFSLCRSRTGARSLEPRGIADLIQAELQDGAFVMSSRSSDAAWTVRVHLVDIGSTVDTALAKSLAAGTTKTATKRASQRASISANRRHRKYADLSAFDSSDAVMPVPLHRIDPSIGRTEHTPRDVVEYMVVRDIRLGLMKSLQVCGIAGISAAAARITDRTVVDPATGAVSVEQVHVIDARGCNIRDLAMLPAIDASQMACNHVMAVYEVAGISAAAKVLFHEFCACLGASGARVDERLIKQFVDVITHRGNIMPFSRHGINRLEKHGVLSKVTFEETLEQLVEAAAFGYFDPLLEVSGNIMVGQQFRFGTNLSKMYTRRDGELVPCGDSRRGAGASAAPDTRVLLSVVTEVPPDDFESDDDGDEYFTPAGTAGAGGGAPRGVAPGGIPFVRVTAPFAHSEELKHRHDKTPPPPDVPFRPWSPALDGGASDDQADTAFVPWSPDLRDPDPVPVRPIRNLSALATATAIADYDCPARDRE